MPWTSLTMHKNTGDAIWLEYVAHMLGTRLVQYSEDIEGVTTYPHCLARYFLHYITTSKFVW